MIDEKKSRTPRNEHEDVSLYANVKPAPHGPIQEGSLTQNFLLVPRMLAVALNGVYFFKRINHPVA